MTSTIARHLEWLEAAPQQLPAAHADPAQELQALRELARTRLPYHQLDRVASRWRALPAATRNTLPRLRLALVSDANYKLLHGCLVATALRHGLALELRELKLADALAADAWVGGHAVDVVLLAPDIRQLHDARAASTLRPDEVASWLQRQGQWYAELAQALQQRSKAVLLLQNFVAPPDQAALGPDEPTSASALCDVLDREIGAAVAGGARTVDLRAMTRALGDGLWYSPTLWDLAKCPLAMEAAPLYADFVLKQIVAAQGRARKCLVLDLDNTLWGGVLADEGPQGIRIRQGDAVGEAFARFQQVVLRMRQQGVLLAICSKNDLALVLEAFDTNRDLVLQRADFAAIRANWQDKASNIAEIAEELGLGLDAMVFFDDNPSERAWVRARLPMVEVVEVPRDPAHYAWVLQAARHFDVGRRTREDSLRAADYQANAERRALSASLGSHDEFIRSLRIRLAISRISAGDLQRSVQLLNKTNQFNFNKRVVTEAALHEHLDDPAGLALCMRLEDRFGDQGLISVVLAQARQTSLVVTDWVMSCRVIGRGVEHAVLDALLAQARSAGLAAVVMEVRPTAVNAMVQEFLQALGLEADAAGAGSLLTYTCPVSGVEPARTISEVVNDI